MEFEKKQILEDIFRYLNAFQFIKIEELMRTDELGTNYDFSAIKDELIYIIDTFKSIEYSKIESFPLEELDKLLKALKGFELIRIMLGNFNPKAGDFINKRKEIINTVKDYIKTINNLSTFLIYYHNIIKKSDIDQQNDIKKNYVMKFDEYIKTFDDTKSQIDNKAKEIDDAYKSIKNLSPTIGISEHEKIFYEEAVGNENKADKWLNITIGLSVYVVIILLFSVLSIWIFPTIYKDLNQERTIHFIIAKALLISFLIYATIWSGKNYKSHIHNSIVNKHRSNSLKTFQIFSIGAESPQTRDAVLLKATDAVFSHQNTGFNSGEHDSSSNNPTILEIIKSFAHDSKT